MKYKVGDNVFARVRSYPPWPAKIVDTNKKMTKNAVNGKIEVLFYGTYQLGYVDSKEVYPYLEHKGRLITDKMMKREAFRRAVDQIEIAMGIRKTEMNTEAHILSLTKKIQASLEINNMDLGKCLELLFEFEQLQIKPLMLKKLPITVDTIRRMRKFLYVDDESKLTNCDKVDLELASRIRATCDRITKQFAEVLQISSIESFWPEYVKIVKEFAKHIEHFDAEAFNNITEDPSIHSS